MFGQAKVDPSIFRRSDIRGIYPTQINLEVAKRIGSACVGWLLSLDDQPRKGLKVAIGRDVRKSSGEIFTGLAEGIMEAGADVVDLDLVGTEVMSFAAATLDVAATAMVSASHNPREFNGIKFLRRGALPVSFESGLQDILSFVLNSNPPTGGWSKRRGGVTRVEILKSWSERVLMGLSPKRLAPLRVVIDTGNGMGGLLLPYLLPHLPLRVTELYFKPDGEFPNHIPNPSIKENLKDLVEEVRRQKADFGVAFDGDADRIVFVDEKGNPRNSSAITALLASETLKVHPGGTILYNAVCGRVVPETIERCGGKAIRVMIGHSVVKAAMRRTGAVFGGEHSGHYYHHEYFDSDSSVLGFFKILKILSSQRVSFSKTLDSFDPYPQSGEINFLTPGKEQIMAEIYKEHVGEAKSFDNFDGISLWYDDWWFNLRPSENENLLRLNVEADSQAILKRETERLVQRIKSLGAGLYVQ